jgi:hypothetical protein
MREIELLRETMAVYGLSPEKAGTYIEVPGITVRRWLRGENEPGEIYRRAIRDGVEKMKREFEPKIAANGGAWFGSLAGDNTPDPDKLKAEADAAHKELNQVLDELYSLLRRHGVEIGPGA